MKIATIQPADLDAIMLSNNNISLTRLFLSQVSTLPKFKGGKGESWQAFESTFRIKWANSVLSDFPVNTQKREILGCLEGPASRAHTLLADGSEGWRTGISMDTFLARVRDIFNPQEESALARLSFEQIHQSINEPITAYYVKS